MNAKLCACRTAALRIFIQILVAPSSAQQQWRRFGGLTRRPAVSGSISRYAIRPITQGLQPSPALQLGRAMHSVRANSDVNAVPGSSGLAPPPALADFASKLSEDCPETEALKAVEGATARIEEPAAEKQLEVSEGKGAQTMGKHQRKKLRRKQEAEAAAAAAAAASKAASSSEAALPSASVVMSAGVVQPTAGDNNATLRESPGDMYAATVVTATAAKAGEKKNTKKPRWTEAQREERRHAREANFGDASPPWSPSRSPPPRSPPSPRSPPRSLSSSPAQSSRSPRAKGWQIQKLALEAKFPEGWQPRKKLSPDALDGIRALHRQFPETYTTPVLAKHFKVSAEAVRRILKSQWEPKPEEEVDRQERWFKRGKQIWARYAALGRKPPKRWQAEGIRRDASWAGRRQRQLEWRQQQALREEQEGEEIGGRGEGERGEGRGGKGEREERGERLERRERPERPEQSNGRYGQNGRRGWREQDKGEGFAAAASRPRPAGLEADPLGAALAETLTRGRTQSQGKRMRLQREQQRGDGSGTSSW